MFMFFFLFITGATAKPTLYFFYWTNHSSSSISINTLPTADRILISMMSQSACPHHLTNSAMYPGRRVSFPVAMEVSGTV